MYLATINRPRQILYFIFGGQVTAQELKKGQDEVAHLLNDLGPGIKVATDLSGLESIEPACAAIIGQVMELCDRKGVEMVVRIIPDPSKDIGLNILSLFHYHRLPRAITCANLAEAAKALAL